MARQRKQQENIHTDSVKTLDNDYVRSKEELLRQKQRKQRMKVIERRRIALFLAGAVVICAFLTWGLINQKERLSEKQVQLVEAKEQLATVEAKQEMLNLQIDKLEDDEYIAKLARKEYFLSEEGEIIFTIPKEEKSDSGDAKKQAD